MLLFVWLVPLVLLLLHVWPRRRALPVDSRRMGRPPFPRARSMMQNVITELETAGFRIAGVVRGVIVGERRVPGMPGVYRVCSVWADGQGWCARLKVTRPMPQRPTGRVEDMIAEHRFTDVLDFAVWLGGCCSVPVSRAEVAALESRPTEAV